MKNLEGLRPAQHLSSFLILHSTFFIPVSDLIECNARRGRGPRGAHVVVA
jgi:hypothetical protein